MYPRFSTPYPPRDITNLNETCFTTLTNVDIMDFSQVELSHVELSQVESFNASEIVPLEVSQTQPTTSSSSKTDTPLIKIGKKSRKSYSLTKKLEVIQLFDENNGDAKKTSVETGIERKLVLDWSKSRDAIENSKNKSV